MTAKAQVTPGPTVVKLGGSLLGEADGLGACLAAWLAAVATAPGPPRVVVPGGGPFADAVRAAQARRRFHDLAAHRMAILAMQQCGLVLQALEPRLGLAETEAELAAVVPGAGAVWLPWRMVGLDATVEPSWDVTSDSLALVLARRLGAPRLLLVKAAAQATAAAPAGGGAVAAGSLSAAGVLDPAFPRLARGYAGAVFCAPAAAGAAAGGGGGRLRRMVADPAGCDLLRVLP